MTSSTELTERGESSHTDLGQPAGSLAQSAIGAAALADAIVERAQLQRVGHRGAVHIVSGRSQETIPAFFADQNHPQTLSLITVDGDYRDPGALADLNNVGPHLALGGMLAFDDIAYPGYTRLGGRS